MKAVVFVDVQNDFVKGGKLAFGYPTEDNLQKIIDFAKECVDAYCNDSTTLVRIYATRDTHDAKYMKTLEGQKLPVEHCVEGTNGWQIVDPLMEVLLGKATFINKPTFGSYDLADIIEEDIDGTLDEIVICGYDLAICIISNALLLRAKYPNAKITIKKDLCGCISEETFNAALCVAKCCQIDIK